MKTLALILACTLSSLANEIPADAYEILSTVEGKDYREVTVTKVEPDGLRIRHRTGLAKLKFSDLSPDIQKKYHYNQQAAETFSAKTDAQSEARDRALILRLRAQAKAKEKAASEKSGQRDVDAAAKTLAISRVDLLAKSTAMGRLKDKHWETAWGSYDQNIYRGRAVTATLIASTAGTVTVEVYWLGRHPSTGSDKQIVRVDRAQIGLIPNRRIEKEFAALFVENDVNLQILDLREQNGVKYLGWVVRVVNEKGRTIAVQGARPPMIDFVAQEVREAEELAQTQAEQKLKP